MASKRRERGPSRREKMIERQAYQSMELALIDHQSTDEDGLADGTEEPSEEVLAAASDAAAGSKEATAEVSPAQADESSDSAGTEEEDSKVSDSAEEASVETVAAEAEDGSAEASGEEVAEPSGEEETGLPQKTAHDPTSHSPESVEATGDGATFFWLFLMVLLVIGLFALFRNG